MHVDRLNSHDVRSSPPLPTPCVHACLPPLPRALQGLPMNGEAPTVWLYGAVIALFALLTAWPAPCCNNPAFAEIVPPAQRNLIYAFDRCFEGGCGAR